MKKTSDLENQKIINLKRKEEKIKIQEEEVLNIVKQRREELLGYFEGLEVQINFQKNKKKEG